MFKNSALTQNYSRTMNLVYSQFIEYDTNNADKLYTKKFATKQKKYCNSFEV